MSTPKPKQLTEAALAAIDAVVIDGRFLTLPPSLPSDANFGFGGAAARYDRIIMNPPFSNGLDAKHVTHAFEKFLAPGGRLVAVCSAGAEFRTSTEYSIFRDLIFDCGRFAPIPDGSFKKSGTNVRTTMVILDKPSEGR